MLSTLDMRLAAQYFPKPLPSFVLHGPAMLRLKEFVASVEMAQACGERNARHLDHDGSGVIGPQPAAERLVAPSEGTLRIPASTFRAYYDEATGETLFEQQK